MTDLPTVHRLRRVDSDHTTTYTLDEGEHVVGSSSDASLVIEHPSVSRQHAVLDVGPDGVTVADKASKNGTYVNGKPVREAALQAGDQLQLGPVQFVLERVARDDTLMAVSLSSRPHRRRAGQSRHDSTVTDRADRESRDLRWTRLLRDLGVWLSGPDRNDPDHALQLVVEQLGAAAAVVTETGPDHGAVMVAVAGATPREHLEDPASPTPGAEWDRDPPGSDVIADPAFCFGDDPHPWATVRLRMDDGRSMTLRVLGDFEGRSVSAPLLESIVRLVALADRDRRASAGELPGSGRFGNLVFPADHILAVSVVMRRLYGELAAACNGELPVLILGETGVGKEHIANTIHRSSPNRSGPFIAVNCAAIPANLLESELFGIERGVATGVEARPGFFEMADQGTLFLDEIGDMPEELQVKLLRALESGHVARVGSRRPTPIDVRIVSATNRDLEPLLLSGRLRTDLHYRLAGSVLRIPPLRSRPEDIPPLVAGLFRAEAARANKAVRGLTVAAMDRLCSAPWPGNVRELIHEIRLAVARCPEGSAVETTHLSSELADRHAPSVPGDAPLTGDLHLQPRIDALQRRLVLEALHQVSGNKTHAAQALGITRNGLLKMMKRLHLET